MSEKIRIMIAVMDAFSSVLKMVMSFVLFLIVLRLFAFLSINYFFPSGVGFFGLPLP